MGKPRTEPILGTLADMGIVCLRKMWRQAAEHRGDYV